MHWINAFSKGIRLYRIKRTPMRRRRMTLKYWSVGVEASGIETATNRTFTKMREKMIVSTHGGTLFEV